MANIDKTSLSIVQIVRQLHQVPIDYIARSLGQSRPEIERYLDILEQEGAVRRVDDSVVEP
ncbi:MAG TPA: hypothetical protein VFQ82_03300 [Stellaceae bacterium]|jgi:DeoR/GlpR family transcriptional regulator of sugar metabolism|nr:hypothetical protein [Stellaceae bacterium]